MIVTRYHNTEKLDLTVEFVTPAFLGGADQNAELRAAPFKAGIRYWWRVLYGNKYKDHIELGRAEEKLFGSTEKGSQIRLQVVGNLKTEKTGFSKGKMVEDESKGRIIFFNILDYLAYGHYKYQTGRGNIYLHSHICPGQVFEMNISVPVQSAAQAEVCNSIRALFLYGGVGSRARNGFGSLQTNLAKDFPLELGKISEPKSFPVVSNESRLFLTKAYSTWEEALSNLGIAYRNARKAIEPKHTFTKRGLISRPIKVDGEKIPDNICKGRHPKPFYFGIKRDQRNFLGQIVSMPIEFYEKDNQEIYRKTVQQFHLELSKHLADATSQLLHQLEVSK